MPLEMVYLDDGNIQGKAQGLGEGCAHKQRAQQAGAAGKSYRSKIGGRNSRTGKRLAHHGDNIKFVCPGSKFRHHPSICLVHVLAGDYVRQQPAIGDDGGGSIVAGALYS